MKRLWTVVVIAALAFGLAGCGGTFAGCGGVKARLS